MSQEVCPLKNVAPLRKHAELEITVPNLPLSCLNCLQNGYLTTQLEGKLVIEDVEVMPPDADSRLAHVRHTVTVGKSAQRSSCIELVYVPVLGEESVITRELYDYQCSQETDTN